MITREKLDPINYNPGPTRHGPKSAGFGSLKYTFLDQNPSWLEKSHVGPQSPHQIFEFRHEFLC